MGNIKSTLTTPRAYKLFATGLFSFLVAYVAASVFMPVEASSATDISDTAESNMQVKVSYNPIAYYINVSSAHATAGSAISLDYSTSSTNLGNVIASSDTVSMKTNSPMNRYLYLSTNSSSNVLSSSDEPNGDSITAGGGDNLASASALSDNTWGFALPSSTSGLPSDASFDADYSSVSNSSKFAKVPTLNNEVLIQQASGSGDETDTSETTSTADVYYGVKGTSSLLAGTYSNTIKYTAFAESPDQLYLYPNTIDVSNPRQSILIYTDISTTDATIEGETATVRIYTGSGHDASGAETGTVGYCANASVSLYKENSTDTSGFVTVSCLAPSLVAGSYGMEITFTNLGRVITKGSALTYENQTSNAFSSANITYLQDLTTSVCSNANSGDTFTLKDSRDGKSYSIAKLADGNCWMTQNLALDGGRDLTPADSDVTTTRTLPDNISDGTPSAEVAQIYSGSTDGTIDNSHSETTDQNGSKFGNMYNWYAATATVGTSLSTGLVYESICPKGWRLPDYTGDKSWIDLFPNYTDDDGNALPSSNVTDAESVVSRIQKAPFYLPFFRSNDDNPDASYHTRAVFGSDIKNTITMYFATYNEYFKASNIFWPFTIYNSKAGYSNAVRCVFQGDTIENNMYMQDITTTMCDNLAESTASVDNRRTAIDGRDNKTYKISKLADGNCWMVQNLALDGNRTLQPTDSNVTTNHALEPNIASGTTSAYDSPQILVSPKDSSYNLYNWNAATATVGLQATTTAVSESVCPKGWKLPNSTGTDTYNALANAYGYTSGTNAAAVAAVQQAPLYFVYTGLYNGAFYEQDNIGAYTTNSPSRYQGNVNLITAFDFYSPNGTSWNVGNGFYPNGSGAGKQEGRALRCVLGS